MRKTKQKKKPLFDNLDIPTLTAEQEAHYNRVLLTGTIVLCAGMVTIMFFSIHGIMG